MTLPVIARDMRLHLENVSKTFSGQTVLRNVDLDVAPGEIHGLVGQNGSGKSTLIKILAGYHQPDDGARAWMNGEAFAIGSATEPVVHGVRFVHQDLALVHELDAVDNMALGGGYARGRLGVIRWRDQRQTTLDALAKFGVQVDIDIPLSRLAPVERTAVAIVRALVDWDETSGLLVLDEPTASLPTSEVERLHMLVREVSSRGAAVIYVSHRLDDIVTVADRVTVLREGACVGTWPLTGISALEIATLMVGHRIEQPGRPRRIPRSSEVVLKAEGLRGRWLDGADIQVRRGEIVGIAGVLGSGREELPYALAGSATTTIAGRVTVDGSSLEHGSPRSAQRLGIGFVPADRGREAMVAPFTLRENLTLACLPRIASRGLTHRSAERAIVTRWMDRFAIVPSDPERPLPRFSGGNQQKVMLARVLSRSPKILVLTEPTAGVDIGAREMLYELLRSESRQRDLTVIVASSDTNDLLELCHRVVILRDGRVVGSLVGDEISEASIIEATEVDGSHYHHDGASI